MLTNKTDLHCNCRPPDARSRLTIRFPKVILMRLLLHDGGKVPIDCNLSFVIWYDLMIFYAIKMIYYSLPAEQNFKFKNIVINLSLS